VAPRGVMLQAAFKTDEVIVCLIGVQEHSALITLFETTLSKE
jgi:hypothetical protein